MLTSAPSSLTRLAVASRKDRRQEFASAVERLDAVPGIEAILQPLLSYLQKPFEQQDMQRIVDLISHDNSLAAQCLHIANSPLFGRWQAITSVRAAVVALGLQRMRDIAVSCCILKLMPESPDENPIVLWEHSLGCALVARKLAKRIGARDPEQVYLAGLLHDLGFMVNLRVVPEEFYQLLRKGRVEHRPLEQVEYEAWGCTHCDTGAMLAKKWGLSAMITEVITHHHRISSLCVHKPVVALVSLCDVLCRDHGLGFGYAEEIEPITWDKDERVSTIQDEWPVARSMNWPSISAEIVTYMNEVRKLVTVLFRLPA